MKKLISAISLLILVTSCAKTEVPEPADSTSCNFYIYELKRGYINDWLCKYVWTDSTLVGTIPESEALEFYGVKCGESKIIDWQADWLSPCGYITKPTKKIHSK